MEDYINFIAKAWQDFIYTGNIHPKVRNIIADSWRRCRNYGVDSVNGKGVNNYKDPNILISENADLISISKPIMESIYSIVSGSGFSIILTDKDGYIIEVIGDTDIMERADKLNFVKGELWTEASVGTNAIGTALYLDKPIQTIGAEHFRRNQHSWTCSASPIHDEDGNLIGCINMSGNSYNAHSHTLGIVTSAAQSIQKQLALIISYNLMNITFHSISEGMIVLDEQFKIKKINDRAMEILNIKIEEAINMDIINTLSSINLNEITCNTNKTFNNVECDFCIKVNRIKCIINAVPMKVNEKLVGIVITFREAKYLHKLVNKFVGYKASYTFEDIITKNEKTKAMLRFAKKAAKSDCNILIQGESGTGKELIAQSIHNYSNRSSGSFVAVNCASIPRELVESELFGYEKGAFTGASKDGHPGKFELADGGTIFLDEIGELPLDIQTKLLRVLDNNKVTRVGSTYEKQLNVRVIGATNRILKDEIKKKNFRQDLYYRLNVMNINTIPLRERKEDIEVLVQHFVKILSIKNSHLNKTVKKSYINELVKYYWMGNVRELRNVVERDYYLSDGDLVTTSTIDDNTTETVLLENPTYKEEKSPPLLSIQSLEKQNIEQALINCKGNIVKASTILNISRSTLYRKIKKYNIQID